MAPKSSISRRKFLQSTAMASAAIALPRLRALEAVDDSTNRALPTLGCFRNSPTARSHSTALYMSNNSTRRMKSS